MGLVDYSDSDASEDEQVQVSNAPKASTKPAFKKVVDRSNPGKIQVSLPQAVSSVEKSDEPPAKRVKTSGGGAFSGFNSFLPAPKRAPQANSIGGNTAKNPGLGSGVNLKTGATPGFSREPEPEREYVDEEDYSMPSTSGLAMNLPAPKDTLGQKLAADVKLVGKPLMFKPLSVSRKPAKKKKQITETSSSVAFFTPTNIDARTEVPTKPKVSLFSMAAEPKTVSITKSHGEYKSIIYKNGESKDDEKVDAETFDYGEQYAQDASQMAPPPIANVPVSQSLDDIAGDLNLSAAERRQLFGRQKGGKMQSASKVINFNTDQEYLHNEELRATGEQVTHNPVRAIAPGKHSLKQLVNAAQSQREALEESFAKGKSNRAEASSRYGW